MRILRAPIFLFALVFSSSALADLAVYDVEAKYRQEVFAALRGILTPERSAVIGQIQMLPSGQILIDTSPEMHEQIAAVIRAIDERESEPAPRVTLRYWAVLGSRDPDADSDTPDILSNVLGELRRVHGDLAVAFRVLGNATLVTQSGQQGELDGEPLSVAQEAYVEGDMLNAELEISFFYRSMSAQFQVGNAAEGNQQVSPFQTLQSGVQRVELNTSMRRGEFVVVGENSIRQNTVAHGELDGTIFYIVHWSDAE